MGADREPAWRSRPRGAGGAVALAIEPCGEPSAHDAEALGEGTPSRRQSTAARFPEQNGPHRPGMILIQDGARGIYTE